MTRSISKENYYDQSLSIQRTLTIGGRKVQLVSSLTRLELTDKENELFFVCT